MFDEFAELVIALIYTEYRNVKFPLDFHMGNFETLEKYFLVYFLKRSRRQFFSVVFFQIGKCVQSHHPQRYSHYRFTMQYHIR